MSALNEAETERLTLLIEECGEVIQAATKIIRHGWGSRNPNAIGEDNSEHLHRELGDLYAAVSILVNAGDVSLLTVEEFRRDKLQRVGKYLHYNTVAIGASP